MNDDSEALVRRAGGDRDIFGNGHATIVVDRPSSRLRDCSRCSTCVLRPSPTRPKLLRVLQARDVADLGEPDFTLEDLLDQWRASEFDLASDAVLAVDEDEAVIGYATLWTQGALAVVDPAREGEGVGSALLSWAERRAREAERGVARQWVAGSNATGHELLGRAGYRHIRSYWRLARRLESDLRAPEPPAGRDDRGGGTRGGCRCAV